MNDMERAAASMARSAELMALSMLLREARSCGSCQVAIGCQRLATHDVKASFCYPNLACDEHAAAMYESLQRSAKSWQESGHQESVEPPEPLPIARMVRRFYELLKGEVR